MPTLKRTLFASANDVEVAFYDAMSRGDLEAMMACWAEDEEIVCIHPGGGRLHGYASIRESWAQIFAGQHLQVRFTLHGHHNEQLSAIHYILEEISIAGDPQSQPAPVVATNVFIRGALGWRILLHHSSAAPPDALAEVGAILH